MKYWFVADCHFGHASIIKYAGRTLFMNDKEKETYEKLKNASQEEQKRFKISYGSLMQMDKVLIENFNKRVKEDDITFYLGDFCFKRSSEAPEGNVFDYYRNQLICRNIIFIKGNHDNNNSTRAIIESLVIKHGGKLINLVHNPEFVDEKFEINFCGHCHKAWKFKRIRKRYSFTDVINIGVDVWFYRPVEINEILKEYNLWKKQND